MRRSVFALPFLALLLLTPPPGAAAPANSCVFTVSMTSGVDLNNLDFTVNYGNADGIISGEMAHPDCARALNGQAFAGFRDDQAGHLKVSMIRLSYFSAPVALIGCRFLYDTLVPLPSDFSVTVTTAARDGNDENIVPLPNVSVTKVECPGELPEPTTTTTTLPEQTTTTVPTGSGSCGVPVSGGDHPSASDALFALQAAVGAETCELCLCDINSNGSVGASDALGILKAAVGISVELNCPAC